MMASVLPTIETPTNLVRSHFPSLMLASACATLRATAASRAMPCSAAATVLAVGALTTRQPAAVAALRSTLSTPTPARPTTLRRPPEAANTAASTCVAERMIRASDVLTFSLSCSGVRPRATSTLPKASSLARPEGGKEKKGKEKRGVERAEGNGKKSEGKRSTLALCGGCFFSFHALDFNPMQVGCTALGHPIRV